MPKIIQPNGKVETCFHIQSVECYRLNVRKEFWPWYGVKLRPPIFPTEINSNGNNFNRQKSIFKTNATMFVC